MSDLNELSGGQQQKVLIARALARKAGVLLLDEPTSNLDIKHQLKVMEIIKNPALHIRFKKITILNEGNH